MTEEEARVEALWTYTISKEKVLHRLVKKGIIPQEEADKFSDLIYEELDVDDVPGFRISSLGEKMRSYFVTPNPYELLTEIAREKKTATSSYLIQRFLTKKNGCRNMSYMVL